MVYKSGLVIYSNKLKGTVEFYSHVLELNVIEKDKAYARLGGDGFEISILETDIAKALAEETEKPLPRESTPIKPIFFLDTTLDSISDKVVEKGGLMFPPKDWELDGRVVCDGCDCDGNIFQFRLLRT